jgi:Domain of unknown function (DUF4139)/N-terminal domain of unknown function (DUF4140)
MKKILILSLCLIFSKLYSQNINEKKVESKIDEVTVFIKDAQVTRKKSVSLKQGETVLKFINLSPFIKAKSIQVKANGNVTVLSVNHQQNYIDKLDKKKEQVDLELQLQEIEDKIKLEKTYLEILKEELLFLEVNRDIGGKNQALSVTNLKESSIFYSDKLTSLKLKEIERNKTLLDLIIQKNEIDNQINTLTSIKEFPNGEILVKVESKDISKVNFELSYLVGNSGWFPTYDIRAKNVNEPIELIYKANVKQDTKVDWNNVKLKLSSANPNISGVAPKLITYFLNYNTLPPNYSRIQNEVSGKVFDENQEPLPGANVVVKGTTIGATTDFDGNYSITIPSNSNQLEFSYIGFITQTLSITSPILNVYLEEDSAMLEEVVVIGYGEKNTASRKLSGKVEGIKIRGETSIRGNSSLQIQSQFVEKQTTVDFEIEIPYSIKSDNKSYSVDMASYSLQANFQYYSVPKIDKSAFLIANISDWEKYNLLEGEANIFFEDTYVGKTLLDVRYASDTLQISLGRDKNVSVNREKIKDYTTKQFIGNKKEELRGWNITVKNNKSQKINMLIYDQVPVSSLEEIKVEVLELSRAKHNKETGEIKWEFSIEPNNNKSFELKYSVKYPKFRNLIIE